jgi:hypothetical protein
VCARDWPEICVLFNGNTLFHDKVVGSQQLTFVTIPAEHNLLQIQHVNKNSDTVIDNNGSIILDRHCLVENVSVNHVVMDINFFSSNLIFYHTVEGDKIITNYLGNEGSLDIEFLYPMWKFWHQLQVKTDPANL